MKPKSIPNRPPMIKFFKNCLSTSLQIKGVRKIAIARLCKLLNCNASLLLNITKNVRKKHKKLLFRLLKMSQCSCIIRPQSKSWVSFCVIVKFFGSKGILILGKLKILQNKQYLLLVALLS